MDDGAKVYEDAFIEGLRPDPDLTVSQWSDKYRMLSNKASSEPGPWRTDRTPYLQEIMDWITQGLIKAKQNWIVLLKVSRKRRVLSGHLNKEILNG